MGRGGKGGGFACCSTVYTAAVQLPISRLPNGGTISPRVQAGPRACEPAVAESALPREPVMGKRMLQGSTRGQDGLLQGNTEAGVLPPCVCVRQQTDHPLTSTKHALYLIKRKQGFPPSKLQGGIWHSHYHSGASNQPRSPWAHVKRMLNSYRAPRPTPGCL